NVGFRVMLLQQLTISDEGIPNKRERVEVLANFLDDSAVYDREKNEARFPFFKPSAYPTIEVRDFAALMIAELLEIKVEVDPKRTLEEWARIRVRMREASKRQGERPK